MNNIAKIARLISEDVNNIICEGLDSLDESDDQYHIIYGRFDRLSSYLNKLRIYIKRAHNLDQSDIAAFLKFIRIADSALDKALGLAAIKDKSFDDDDDDDDDDDSQEPLTPNLSQMFGME